MTLHMPQPAAWTQSMYVWKTTWSMIQSTSPLMQTLDTRSLHLALVRLTWLTTPVTTSRCWTRMKLYMLNTITRWSSRLISKAWVYLHFFTHSSVNYWTLLFLIRSLALKRRWASAPCLVPVSITLNCGNSVSDWAMLKETLTFMMWLYL